MHRRTRGLRIQGCWMLPDVTDTCWECLFCGSMGGGVSWCLQGAVGDCMDGVEDMKRLLQRKLGGEPGGRQELVDRELNKKHEEISGYVSNTGEMAVRLQSRRISSKSMVCCCCQHLLGATLSADDGIDGDAMKKRALSLGQGELLRQELNWEFKKKLGQFNMSNIVSAIRDKVPSSCLSFASNVLCFCNHILHMMLTCGANFIEEMNKLLRRIPGQEPVRQIGWEPGWKIGGMIDPEIIDRELGRVPGQEQDPYCEFNYARNVSEACSPNITLLHQELTKVAPLRKNHAEISGGAFLSEGGATADPTDSLVIITQIPGYYNRIDAVDQDVVVGTAPPHDVDELIVVEVVLEVDRGVEDVAVGEETEDPDGDGEVTDKVVSAKETVDFGDDGNPIVLEVLSPAEYTEIVSNLCHSLTLVDADYQ